MTLCEVRRLQRAIAEYERELVVRHGLSLNECMLLCALREHGGLYASKLAELLGLSMSNTSKVIRSVEDKRLIERSICAEDKRQMCFSISGTGRSALAAIESDPIEMADILVCALASHSNKD